ncbi:N-terminal glutamine amidase-domain-containing protein [Mycena albidolilacea]|uniref:Protein N-terminal glutamine amidohydrolase n=1 Tax=Mycena albidolilacea TaxID=1033008 RepID=A0AAD6ZXP7_9AGAR|nr:N-terminal glutamine amidase-domain-containing protein [Mycena albidolilacea]
MLDPPSPPETVYTPFYCEENIYLLCEAFIAQQEDASVIIVSNELKTVALWNQKLSESVVVWDYHVVLLVRSRDQQHWIYDFDTRLPFPCLMQDYLSHTFREDVRSSYQSVFRIVPGPIFVEHFASDRSHMLTDASDSNSGSEASSIQTYRSPPPSHSPIRGKNARVANNLMRSFVCMIPSDETFGYVNDLRAMIDIAET